MKFSFTISITGPRRNAVLRTKSCWTRCHRLSSRINRHGKILIPWTTTSCLRYCRRNHKVSWEFKKSIVQTRERSPVFGKIWSFICFFLIAELWIDVSMYFWVHFLFFFVKRIAMERKRKTSVRKYAEETKKLRYSIVFRHLTIRICLANFKLRNNFWSFNYPLLERCFLFIR